MEGLSSWGFNYIQKWTSNFLAIIYFLVMSSFTDILFTMVRA